MNLCPFCKVDLLHNPHLSLCPAFYAGPAFLPGGEGLAAAYRLTKIAEDEAPGITTVTIDYIEWPRPRYLISASRAASWASGLLYGSSLSIPSEYLALDPQALLTGLCEVLGRL